MDRIVILFVFCVLYLQNEANAQTARIPDHQDFIRKIATKAMLEVEKLNWSNLKIDDFHQTLNERMYNWQVVGNVSYTNGYVVSIQKIDIDNMQGTVSSTQATIQFLLFFRNLKSGFDVQVQLDDGSTHKYTGIFDNERASLRIFIIKTLATGTTTVTVNTDGWNGGSGKMEYLPADNLTEVLSRRYVTGNPYDSLSRWGSNIIQPILVSLLENEIPFPEICLTC